MSFTILSNLVTGRKYRTFIQNKPTPDTVVIKFYIFNYNCLKPKIWTGVNASITMQTNYTKALWKAKSNYIIIYIICR